MGDSGSERVGPDPEAADAVQEFYGRWVGLYDLIARHTPRIAAGRRAAADACRLSPGDRAVEMGCGTGANLPYLRSAVGPEGLALGLDVTGPAVAHARRTLDVPGDPALGLVRGDATRPPVRGPVDAVLGTFVSGMFPDPAAAVDRWCDLAPGGHVVLVDAAPSRRPLAAPLNAAFRGVVALSTPPTFRLRYDEDVTRMLDDRVTAAHRRLSDRAEAVATAEYLFGFVRLTGGRIPEE
ncbi:methyltransferase type 11 [Halobacteriales archaeon QS_8_69_26]|nr:MAG: methyltransferase type 11 [Halobacteriales archaeon QS_8_69_26]